MSARKLRITTQLSLGFGLLILLFLLLSLVAWLQTNEMERRATELYTHPLQARRALGALKSDILSMGMALKNLCLGGQALDPEAELQDLGLARADALQQFGGLESSYLGESAEITRAAADFARWDGLREETLRLLREGRRTEAAARVMTGGPEGDVVAALLGELQKLDDVARGKADALFADVLSTKRDLNLQLLLVALLSLALALVLSLVLTDGIRRPLAEISAVAERFRSGDWEARSSWASGDEFGVMALAFNKLAAAVEAELRLGEASSEISAIMLSENEARAFSRKLLSALLARCEAQVGALYLPTGEGGSYELFEGIGLEDSRRESFSASTLEGEFGQALATGKLQRITDIAEGSRFALKTVSGTFLPREILTLPLMVGAETRAVLSLASLKGFREEQLRLLDSVALTLSARLDGVLAYRRLSDLSLRLQEQNRELEIQKNELSTQTRELSQQNLELERQKVQLGEANRLKTSFLSTMSHELRTPLNSVIALSGVLGRRLDGKVGAEERSFLEIIERNGKQLLALINDILDIARVESGREELDLGDVDLGQLLGEVGDTLRQQAILKGIELRTEVEGGLPPIRSDYGKCRHILQNIAANAVKFTERGEVLLRATAAEGGVELSVRDTGIGIAASDLGLIFEEFRQADSGSNRRYGGTGLGLAIAKRYAELLGGRIEVESRLGEGSTFRILLPLGADSAGGGERARPRAARPKTGRRAGKNPSILIVEDSIEALIQLKDILEPQGYRIDTARDGAEALELLARRRPDLVILDLMMPEVDGFEVLRRLRESEDNQHLPVVILSAKYVSKEELSFLRHNGVHQVLLKGGIDPAGLLAELEACLDEADPPEERRGLGEVPLDPAARGPLPLVLAAEDNPDNLLTLRALLEGRAELIEARNGAEALEAARRVSVSLVLMDIEMPGMNGIEALRRIRGEDGLRHLPVVAVTARAMRGDREAFLAQGFDEYLSKPLDGERLRELVDRLARPGKGRGASHEGNEGGKDERHSHN